VQVAVKGGNIANYKSIIKAGESYAGGGGGHLQKQRKMELPRTIRGTRRKESITKKKVVGEGWKSRRLNGDLKAKKMCKRRGVGGKILLKAETSTEDQISLKKVGRRVLSRHNGKRN